MRLLVPVSELSGYDRDLVQALFFSGRQQTDTDAIKAHYKASGFDPSSKIKPGLEAKLKTHADFQDKAPASGGRLTVLLFLAGFAAHGYAVLTGAEELGSAIARGDHVPRRLTGSARSAPGRSRSASTGSTRGRP